MSEPNLGEVIADFTLPSTDGEFCLSAHRGQIVVIYFYPKDDTPGCTIESGEFSGLLPAFAKVDAVIVGVSRDNIRSHEKFRQKFNYAHHLLADSEATLCEQFAVLKDKTMYGKAVRSISRSTFLIDKDGILQNQWRDIKDSAGHAAEVLTAVRTL